MSKQPHPSPPQFGEGAEQKVENRAWLMEWRRWVQRVERVHTGRRMRPREGWECCMPQPTLVWRTPPDLLARAIEQYGEKVIIAVAAVAQRLATIMENSAKQNAPWTDRTGNARSGLFGTSETDLARHLVIIYLSHGPVIDYGVYLELAHGGRYAIIVRTIESHLPQLHAMLNEIFG